MEKSYEINQKKNIQQDFVLITKNKRFNFLDIKMKQPDFVEFQTNLNETFSSDQQSPLNFSRVK